jgi:general secretion pathway protein B
VPSIPPPAAVPSASQIAETDEDEEGSSREARRSRRQSKASSSTASSKQLVQTVQPPADIKLSGIAWQDERAARRAVINGFLLKEGAVVSGAKITEIKADRVRFSSAAGQFEIKLDAVLPPEVKR